MDKEERIARLNALTDKLLPKSVANAGQFLLLHANKAQKVRVEDSDAALIDPCGTLGHHLNNSVIGLGFLDHAVGQLRDDMPVPDIVAKTVKESIDAVLNRTRQPFQEFESQFPMLFSERHPEYADAKRHFDAIKGYRDMLRDEKDAIIAEVDMLLPSPKALGPA